MFHVVLVAPEIATNTGNIIRLCANAGAVLHLVEPLGFSLAQPQLRRAGLDYHELADVRTHPSWQACWDGLDTPVGHRFALSGRGTRRYDEVRFDREDVLVFGAERAGLDRTVLDRFEPRRRLAIPMRPANRSLNLANAVAVVLYEAWRQHGFAGADGQHNGSIAESPAGPPFDRIDSARDGAS